MRSDAEIRDGVIRDLRWDPQITEPDAIGVAFKKQGRNPDQAHAHLRREAGRCPAAKRVYGVKPVANDLGLDPDLHAQPEGQRIEIQHPG
jgi:hypothetical protein